MVGVSPFKGRPMDEILDAGYKVVEHQIAPPLGPLSALAEKSKKPVAIVSYDEIAYYRSLNADDGR